MAVQKRKKKKTLIRFELSLWGLFGLVVVCFCVFLWMFLLGLWAGQTVLKEDGADNGSLISVNRLAGTVLPSFLALPDERVRGA